MFFQLIVAISIWTTGVIVQFAKGYPKFYGDYNHLLYIHDIIVKLFIYQPKLFDL